MIAVRLVGLAEEFTPDQKHATATRIKDPHGETVNEMGGNFAIGAESARPDYLTGVTLPMVVRFDVAEEGTYAVECEFGGAEKSLPIHVVHGLPPGFEPPDG